MKIKTTIEIIEGDLCGQYINNYSHEGEFIGCRFYKYGHCMIFKDAPRVSSYVKSKKWEGSVAKVHKLNTCIHCGQLADEKEEDNYDR